MRRALLLSSAIVALAGCVERNVPAGPSESRSPRMHAVVEGVSLVLSGLGTLASTSLWIEFDNDHDGTLFEVGDDLFGMNVGPFLAAELFDDFRITCPGDPPGSAAMCSAYDAAATPAGTNDGMAAATNDGRFTVSEMAHPLHGSDDAHDFSLGPGQTVGFGFYLDQWSLDPSCNSGPDCDAGTPLPASQQFGDIVIGFAVDIDVRPGSATNPINLGAGGVVPVALLGSPSFDSRTMDAATVRFAGAPVRRVAGTADVNADGFDDLVFQFDIPALALAADATQAELSGRTSGGAMVRGTDVVRVVPRAPGL